MTRIAGGVGIWVLLGLLWIANLPLRPLFDPDEGRYSEIPREMVASGDWVTPRVNDLKYFEKPPLQYWATATLYSAFGVHPWAGRAWAAVLAFLCIPMVFAFARRLGLSRDTSVIAAALLAINPYFAITGQLNLLDQGFCFFLVLAVFAFVLAQVEAPAGGARRWMLVTWASLALAVLSKGIVALVLPGATLFIYMLVARDWSPLRRLHWLVGLPLFLVIVVPWFLLVQERNPEFANFFFVHEHFERFLTKIHERVEPWWYFLAILVVAMLPVLWNLRSWRTAPRLPAAPGGFKVTSFLLIWCAVVLLFFSVSQSKLATYIMPMMPPIAVLLAPIIGSQSSARGRATWTTVILLIVFAVGIVAVGWKREGSEHHAALAWAAAAGVLCVAWFIWSRRAADESRQWLGIAALCIAAYQCLFMCYDAAFPARGAARLAAQLSSYNTPDTTIYSVGQYRHTLVFYLQHTVKVYAYAGELDFGMRQAGQHPEQQDRAAFLARWQQERKALAIVDPRAYPAMQAAGMPGKVIASDASSVVVSRT